MYEGWKLINRFATDNLCWTKQGSSTYGRNFSARDFCHPFLHPENFSLNRGKSNRIRSVITLFLIDLCTEKGNPFAVQNESLEIVITIHIRFNSARFWRYFSACRIFVINLGAAGAAAHCNFCIFFLIPSGGLTSSRRHWRPSLKPSVTYHRDFNGEFQGEGV